MVDERTTQLALPRPEDVALSEVRDVLLPRAAELRRDIAARGDVALARECCRQLEAFRAYLRDREGRDLLAAECRRMEVLIGKLLGPAPQPGKDVGRGRELVSPAGETNSVPPDDRHKFRLLAANEEFVEGLLAEGKVSRNAILGEIRRMADGGAEPGNGCTVDDLHGLVARGLKFGTVYADPPWAYGNQGTRAATGNHYGSMSVEDVCALPVRELAADCCHLHLWTTNAFLFDCPRIFDAWGFKYQGVFVWCKPQMGIGNCYRVSHEFLLLAIRGEPRTFPVHDVTSWAALDRGAHSAKPGKLRAMVERVSPGPPRLELFGRALHPGWWVWGNQIERNLFNQEANGNVAG